MQHVQAEWWKDVTAERSQRTVDGPDQAWDLCAEIEAQGVDHVLVSFTTPEGVFFEIGLGAPDSCAMFWESADPPYFWSRGQSLPEGPPVTFWYAGQQTEIPASVPIPRSVALAALREFMTTGQRPENLDWDET
jgi:hypothetical protein